MHHNVDEYFVLKPWGSIYICCCRFKKMLLCNGIFVITDERMLFLYLISFEASILVTSFGIMRHTCKKLICYSYGKQDLSVEVPPLLSALPAPPPPPPPVAPLLGLPDISINLTIIAWNKYRRHIFRKYQLNMSLILESIWHLVIIWGWKHIACTQEVLTKGLLFVGLGGIYVGSSSFKYKDINRVKWVYKWKI